MQQGAVARMQGAQRRLEPTAGQIGVERMCRSIRSACAQMGRAPGPQTALCGQRLGMRVADQRRVKS